MCYPERGRCFRRSPVRLIPAMSGYAVPFPLSKWFYPHGVVKTASDHLFKRKLPHNLFIGRIIRLRLNHLGHFFFHAWHTTSTIYRHNEGVSVAPPSAARRTDLSSAGLNE